MLALSLGSLLVALALCTRRVGWPRPLALGACLAVFVELALYLLDALARSLGAQTMDASVLYHLANGFRGVPSSIIATVVVMAALAFLSLGVTCVWLYRHTLRGTPKRWLGLGVFSLLLVSVTTNPVLLGMAEATTRYMTGTTQPPPEYQLPTDVHFERKPNIVYIYGESLERTFLDTREFPGLAPQLQALERQSIAFTNVQQTYGTDWTIAGMVASQCGLPLSTDIWNSMSGLDGFLSGATCLGDILSAQGYTLGYMGGADLRFGGKGAFYKAHGFGHVQGQQELAPALRDPGYLNEWGLYDDSLFGLFAQRFDQLATARQPFGLFMLTNGTHHPRGNLSKSCRDITYRDGADPILNAVQCTDRLIGDIVRHIRSSPAGAYTIIVIGSDHLAMRSKTWETWLKGRTRRDLLLILTPEGKVARVDRPATTLDVAPTLLGLLSNVHKLGFGRDLLGTAPTLAENKPDPARFLEGSLRFVNTLWDFPSLAQGLGIDATHGVAHVGSQVIQLPALFLLNGKLTVKDVVFPGRHDYFSLSEFVARLPGKQRFVWVDRCGELGWLVEVEGNRNDTALCMAGGALASRDIGVRRLTPDRVDVDATELKAMLDGDGHSGAANLHARVLRIDRIKTYGTANVVRVGGDHAGVADYAVVAGSGPGRRTFVAYLGTRLPLKPGLTLLGLDGHAQATILAHLDACQARQTAEETTGPGFLQRMHEETDRFATYVVVGVHMRKCGQADDLAAILGRITTDASHGIDTRDAYIGIVGPSAPDAWYRIATGTSLMVRVTPLALARSEP